MRGDVLSFHFIISFFHFYRVVLCFYSSLFFFQQYVFFSLSFLCFPVFLLPSHFFFLSLLSILLSHSFFPLLSSDFCWQPITLRDVSPSLRGNIDNRSSRASRTLVRALSLSLSLFLLLCLSLSLSLSLSFLSLYLFFFSLSLLLFIQVWTALPPSWSSLSRIYTKWKEVTEHV